MDTVTWTGEKLDAVDGKVDALADEMHDGFARAEIEYARTDERFIAVNQQLKDLKTGQALMNNRFDAMQERFDAMQRTLVQVGFGLVVGLLGGIVVLIGTVVTLIFTH
jgi:hypothetical protein